MGTVDPNDLADEELADAAVELDRLRTGSRAAEARLLRALQVRRVFAADGAKSAPAWLARRTRAPKGECSSRVRLGRLMEELPVAAEAFAAGEIGAAQVRRLAAARNPRTEALLAEHEPMLVDQARTLTDKDFGHALDYWLLHADPDGADDTERQRRERRNVTLDETLGGMHSGRIFLDPVSGAIVGGELHRRRRSSSSRTGRRPNSAWVATRWPTSWAAPPSTTGPTP